MNLRVGLTDWTRRSARCGPRIGPRPWPRWAWLAGAGLIIGACSGGASTDIGAAGGGAGAGAAGSGNERSDSSASSGSSASAGSQAGGGSGGLGGSGTSSTSGGSASAGRFGSGIANSGSGAAAGDAGDSGGEVHPDGDAGAGCGETLPPMSDYSQAGPFQTTTMDGTGPGGSYTVVQPATLGENGFKHPIATWGNGITTTPQLYPGLLSAVASQGIVVVASDSTTVAASDLTSGLDWMVQQNTTTGPYQGKLDTNCLVTIGYSLGGGAAVTAGSHDHVVTTISFHGVTGASSMLHAPLLLFTSTTDTFVVADTFVTPTYDMSTVPTFYATLGASGDPSNLGHLIPIGDAGPERAPAIAWLRLWVYGDQNARSYFYGSDAILCKDPWTNCQSKNLQ